ncbi:MAG: hypothetical protein CL708_06330 [Chloroflexi bacterium]|jgi:uncharacterized membrane protein YbaN (DUF454 family)|nr:hypothetical protein [Chloroflexota bacterium]|tara:strand:+ start:1961 stop:2353 length:393 start_codon:yes stop_codon:yes gene_type:complete
MSKLNRYKPIRILWILLGSLSVGMGVIGIFVPGWPTTIFLIVASYFYIRSSRRLYNWLINNKLLGIYIKNYLLGKGMPLKAKLVSLIIMWLFGLLSILMWIPNDLFLIRSIVLLLLVIGTFFIIRVKTSK